MYTIYLECFLQRYKEYYAKGISIKEAKLTPQQYLQYILYYKNYANETNTPFDEYNLATRLASDVQLQLKITGGHKRRLYDQN